MRTPLSSTTSSDGSTFSAYSMVWAISAQPPFLTPTRTPTIGPPALAITDLEHDYAPSRAAQDFCPAQFRFILMAIPVRQPMPRYAARAGKRLWTSRTLEPAIGIARGFI